MAGTHRRAAAAIILALASVPALAAPPVVQSGLGGTILGYDVDANGTLGILSEYVPHFDGSNDVAVETFDLQTGAIVKFVREKDNTRDDFVALGVVGGAGLVETEHTGDLFVERRTYNIVDPLTKGKFTGRWTPPLHSKKDIISYVSPSLVSSDTAIMAS